MLRTIALRLDKTLRCGASIIANIHKMNSEPAAVIQACLTRQSSASAAAAAAGASIPEPLPESSPDKKPQTSREKLKSAIRDYGSTVLIFHIASGVTLLSIWYLVISSGVDVSSLICTLGLEGTIGKFAGGASTFVVAYAIHKATAPLRIGLTLTASPIIVNYLRKKGIMKLKS